MKKCKKNKLLTAVGGLATGFFNGLLGAGGGMIAVPFLSRTLEAKKAHATCVAIILPICVASAVGYLIRGAVAISDVMPYVLWGLLGAVIGTFLLKKLNNNIIRKIFAVFMLWAGIRLIWR
ncbi:MULTISPECIES: sulfite exporter TauE/SafE family protein [unclassified Ruminococcus]|uniref:sulfite exporter TauE/SafE family protein n=1 Tax=unclassified Ruminococcus TaxID=2608920 RepID=UPI00210B99CE|nr:MULTISPECIES: sulfite exporter TauE/SafE family protein [unclassified Ruminococcus]MCQ4021657.1 TSUP family transporter [Ruminococcus sp. zg-924]MCQ4114102.1 TSUP family transporter [Ruminococcus sp. zg-921]